MYECIVCGRDFKGNNHGIAYCSNLCIKERGKRCLYCGEEIDSGSFCSMECVTRWTNRIVSIEAISFE